MNNTFVNAQALVSYIKASISEVIGDRNGLPTTLRQEIGEVGRLTYLAESTEVNYWNSRRAFAAVENTEEQREARKNRFYMLAAKKLLFINTACKRRGQMGFITKRVDLKNLDEVIGLVEDFADTLQEIAQ